jgi:hypothetical protein
MHTVTVVHSEKGTQPFQGRAWRAAVLACLFVTMLTIPLGIRAANAARGVKAPTSIYLPAYENARQREPFNPDPISDLARLKPGYVVIGDSMAGRIDAPRLGQLSGRPVAPLLQAGSGSAYWYLALKNWIVASGIRPRVVFIFFRDTNLTDVLFRLSPWSLDHVALEREDELNRVVAMRAGTPAHRLELAVERVYQGELARQWAEPAILQWPARILIPSRRQRLEFINEMNVRFDLDHQRKSDAADVQVSDEEGADFPRFVDRSVLPLMLRDARAAGLTICFVRVQRRPIGGKPPVQSAAIRKYVQELRTFVESHGALFHDDTGDPAMTLEMYEDGDHIAREFHAHYTEIFFARLRPLFQ